MLITVVLTVYCPFILLSSKSSLYPTIPDTPFEQEYRSDFILGETAEEKCIRGVAVDAAGNVWLATRAGIRVYSKGTLQNPMKSEDVGPAFCATSGPDGGVWLGTWNGLYYGTKECQLKRISEINEPVGAVHASGNRVIAMGPEGKWEHTGGTWQHRLGAWPQSPRAITLDKNGDLWVATGHGLFRLRGDEVVAEYHTEDEILTGELRGVALAPDGRIWSSGFGGLDVYDQGKRVACYSTSEGLPSFDARRIVFDNQGRLWVATAIGAARFDGEKWTLRHSKRWLPDDSVNDIAFDAEGTAWIATDNGLSAIKMRRMTLAEKADFFLDICLKRHVRAPYLVEKCLLRVPGDLSTWAPRDDDNDGQYTAMYLGMEAYRYAATQNLQAKENAKKAFDALEFLQHVTETSGFIARTVIPIDWTEMNDANRTYNPQEYAEQHVEDPRWKKVEERWRPSADGKWLWKGDTSSDEITGHFYAYLMYYDYVADETEKERVRQLIRRVMDYIIEGNYTLRDIDGKPTRWGVWTPEVLLHDPDWRAERPTNCAEILAFLNITYHITGDEKYRAENLRLARDYGFAEIARCPKPTALSERTHIDVELLALIFQGLIQYEPDPELKAKYREGLDFWLRIIRDECSPFFGFVYGALGDKDFRQVDCVEFLRNTPLDLIEWTVDNTRREDIRLVRYPEAEPFQTDPLLPASERGIIRWDNNPYAAVQGADGKMESSGVFWLLPYWMGRYYGFIAPPSQ